MPHDNLDYLARNLRVLRAEAGLSQPELARLTGIHQPHISHFERGLHPTAEQVEALAKALNVTTAILLAPSISYATVLQLRLAETA